jgi:hypothetical protein
MDRGPRAGIWGQESMGTASGDGFRANAEKGDEGADEGLDESSGAANPED